MTKRGPAGRRAKEQYMFDDFESTRELLEFILGAALTGAAVRVGLTRDGGALALGVYKGQDYGTEYVRPSEDLATAVAEIATAWEIDYAEWDVSLNQWVMP